MLTEAKLGPLLECAASGAIGEDANRIIKEETNFVASPMM